MTQKTREETRSSTCQGVKIGLNLDSSKLKADGGQIMELESFSSKAFEG